MKQYAVIFEEAEKNWAAYPPDLPGCISTGTTLEECKRNIAEAIEGHIAALEANGYAVPEPTSVVGFIAVA